MKCYFTFDKLMGTKVLIPMCWDSLHQEDLSCYTCKDHPLTYNQFEKQQFNEVVAEPNNEIKDLREMLELLKKDNYQLMRIYRRRAQRGIRA